MGRVLAPHGVKGWIKVAPFTTAPDALVRLRRWRIGGPDGWQEAEVAAAAVHGANVIARLAGYGDRDRAATLRGRAVGVGRDALPATGQDEHYWVDLVGLLVVNGAGEALGTVTGLFSNGAHDVLRVGAGKGERLVPYVPAVVRSVDLAARRIEVDWGLDW
ncbi:MAG: ribosome maturation factor RimM [Burkholderiales bacterium]